MAEPKLAREVASFGSLVRETADEPAAPRTFTEDEHLAILTDRVSTETSAMTETIASKDAEIAALQEKLDVSEAAKLAAETEKAAADVALETYKAEQAAAGELETVAAERRKVVAELTSEDYCTDERVARWAEKSSEDFDAFVADLKDVVPLGTVRESAAFSGGAPASKTGSTTGALIRALNG